MVVVPPAGGAPAGGAAAPPSAGGVAAGAAGCSAAGAEEEVVVSVEDVELVPSCFEQATIMSAAASAARTSLLFIERYPERKSNDE